MATRVYVGTAMALDTVYDGNADYERVERDAADGSLERGYRHKPSGALVNMATVTVSAALQVTLDAAKAAATALDNKDAAARTVIVNQVALTRPKMPAPIGNGTATAQERWLMALSWFVLRQE